MQGPRRSPDAELLGQPISRAVWRLAWPVVAMGVVRAGYFLTDAYFVGQIGNEALNALGGVTFAWWILVTAVDMAGAGTHALVAQRVGAGRRDRIVPVAMQGLGLGLATAAALLVLLPFDGLYFDLLDFKGPHTRLLGSEYLDACLLGLSAFALHAVTAAVFRGLGDTRTPLLIGGITLVLNAGLDPLLIGFMGISGAAWATSLANLAGGVLGLAALWRIGLPLKPVPIELPILRELIAVGLPVTLRGISFSVVYLALGRLITPFGDHQLCALGVGHRLESFPYMTCVGFEVATTTLVGQQRGAGDPQRALDSAHVAARICALCMLPLGALVFLFAEPAFAVFSDDPATIDSGVVYIRCQAVVWWAMAFEAVYEGAFTGASNTVPPFWISFIGTWARVPLGYLLAWPLGLGVTGYWIAIALSTVLKGPLMRLAFGWLHNVSPPESPP